MKYEITYHCTRTNEQHTIEWVVPNGWGQATICECLEQRNPTAEVLFIKPAP
jgi:hypothetical protein